MLEIRFDAEAKTNDFVVSVTANFEDSEISLLRRYVELVDRLVETKLVQRGIPKITVMSWKPGENWEWTCPPYENRDLHELLHVLRPLILSREPASFERVVGLLGRKIEDENFRAHLKQYRTVFEGGELKHSMQFQVGDYSLFEDSTLKLWLNGEQYHTDEEKANAWREIEKIITVEATRALVITQLQAKVKALICVQFIATQILGMADTQPIKPQGAAR